MCHTNCVTIDGLKKPYGIIHRKLYATPQMTSKPKSKESLSHFSLRSLINSHLLQPCNISNRALTPPLNGCHYSSAEHAQEALQELSRWEIGVRMQLWLFCCAGTRDLHKSIWFMQLVKRPSPIIFSYYCSLQMTINLRDTGAAEGAVVESKPRHSREQILSNNQRGLLAFSLSYVLTYIRT